MGKLTALSKFLIAFIALGVTLAAIRTYSVRVTSKPAADVAAPGHIVTETLAVQPSTAAARLDAAPGEPGTRQIVMAGFDGYGTLGLLSRA